MAGLILELVEGPGAGRKAELERPLVLGRAANADLVLDDDQVSRRHARITPAGDAAQLEDLNSTNGTYVNDQAVASQRRLAPGDRVRVGLSVLELRTHDQVAVKASAVRPAPAVTRLDHGVLQLEDLPADAGAAPPPAGEPPPPPPPPAAAQAPAARAPAPGPAPDQPTPAPPPFKAPERAPAYVPPEVAGDAQARSDFNALAALVDPRVKRRTTIAMFAILAIAALALVIFFGAQ